MRTCFFIILFLSGMFCRAQNLVPNPGFEQINTCVDAADFLIPLVPTSQPIKVKNWFSPSKGTPDYFSDCNKTAPNNGFGYHPAHGGQAYAGYIAYNGTKAEPWQYTEFISIELSAPLMADSFYNVACYVKLATRRQTQALVACFNSMSVGFSEERNLTVERPVSSYINLYADDGRYLDTLEWVKISRIYKAKGNEKWLTFGSFLSEDPPYFKSLFNADTTGEKSYYSYYFVDDVSVSKRIGCKIIATHHDTLCRAPGSLSTLSSIPEGNVSYLWNTGDTTRSITVSKDGTYRCMAIRDCDTYIDSFFVKTGIDTQKRKIPHSLSICEGEEHILTPDINGKAYTWANGYAEKEMRINSPGVYTCYINIDNCNVTVEQFKVSLSAGLSDISDPLTDTAVCKDGFIGKDYGHNVSYLWNTGDSICCIAPAESGLYSLTITTAACGSITDSAQIKVNKCAGCLLVPTAFTPNGDGLNDQFRAIEICTINKFSMRIFNRWGQEIFYSTDVRRGWNGMHGTDVADAGAYYYFAEYNTVYDNKMKMLKGDVLLVR